MMLIEQILRRPNGMTAFLEGLAAGYGIAIPVGAVAILIVNTALSGGFRLGFMAGAGAATADLLYAGVAVLAGVALSPTFSHRLPVDPCRDRRGGADRTRRLGHVEGPARAPVQDAPVEWARRAGLHEVRRHHPAQPADDCVLRGLHPRAAQA